MKKSKVIIIIISLLALVSLTIIVLMSLNSKPETLIRIGQIEMREYDVASKIPGRIEWIKFDEGDLVEKNQELMKLTDREMKAKYSQAEGAVETAKAQLNMLIAGARREEIAMANRAYDAASSQFDLAETTYKRMKSLFDDKLLSQQDLDVAFQKFSAAKAQKEASKAQLDMAISGARSEQKDMARGQLNRAIQSMEEVAVYLDESIVVSPISGIISKRYVDIGEVVATGYPVLTVIDPSDVWAELSLPATELERIKIGDEILGRIDGTGERIKFKVSNFSAVADFANWRSTSDKSNFDVRTFNVKLKPTNKLSESVRAGMTVRFELPNKK